MIVSYFICWDRVNSINQRTVSPTVYQSIFKGNISVIWMHHPAEPTCSSGFSSPSVVFMKSLWAWAKALTQPVNSSSAAP